MLKEMTMNEMMEVNGGGGLLAGLIIGIAVEATTKAITGKSASDHVADAMKAGAERVYSESQKVQYQDNKYGNPVGSFR